MEAQLFIAMNRTISIKNTKRIKNLTFTVPSKAGVYLLVGGNGAGKTTILTCLHRICEGNAFFNGFRVAAEHDCIDRYEDAAITYTGADKHSVTFRKREQRWVSQPKANKEILASFGYRSASFIKADAARLSVTQEEIRQGQYVKADEAVKNALNTIFDTDRFSALERLKIPNGKGKNSTYFYIIKEGKNNYYSEKRFSTGELAIIRLVEKLVKAEEQSLILLDEAELALHPTVQLRLLDYLRHMSGEKQLTVFVSTHSTTMIRATRPANIMLLSDEPTRRGHLSVVSPCHPAFAMGFIDELDNNAPDFIFCVEDDMAQLILRELLNQYIATQPREQLRRLQYRIIPVAGWKQTLQFVQNSQKMLFSHSCVRAVLDADVFDPASEDSEDSAERKQRTLAQFPGIAYNLGVTPEVALVAALEKPSPDVTAFIRERFYTDIAAYTQSAEYRDCKKDKPRALAKKKLGLILSTLEAHCAQSEDAILAQLVPVLLSAMYSHASLAATAGKLLAAKR